MKKKEPEGPAPNIRFVGKDREEHGKTIPAEALRKINNGEQTIMLPGEHTKADTVAQSKGFFHEQATTIVRLYPDLYKLEKSKGE